MSATVVGTDTEVSSKERLAVLFEELSELAGQRNAIDGRIVDIVAEIDHDGIWGNTGARSVTALVAWKLGASHSNAAAIAAVAHRSEEFPRCTEALREGRLSLDQVGVIAALAGRGGGQGAGRHQRHLRHPDPVVVVLDTDTEGRFGTSVLTPLGVVTADLTAPVGDGGTGGTGS